MVAGKEVTPEDRRNAKRLRRYWTVGLGAAKINWGTPGDWTRCVANLQDHMADPKGYCADLHHEVLGYWPGDRRNRPGKRDKKGR